MFALSCARGPFSARPRAPHRGGGTGEWTGLARPVPRPCSALSERPIGRPQDASMPKGSPLALRIVRRDHPPARCGTPAICRPGICWCGWMAWWWPGQPSGPSRLPRRGRGGFGHGVGRRPVGRPRHRVRVTRHPDAAGRHLSGERRERIPASVPRLARGRYAPAGWRPTRPLARRLATGAAPRHGRNVRPAMPRQRAIPYPYWPFPIG